MNGLIGSTVQGVAPQLPNTRLTVDDFRAEYWGEWKRVKWAIEKVSRLGSDRRTASAKIHLIVRDTAVKVIEGKEGDNGMDIFYGTNNLFKVILPHVVHLGEIERGAKRRAKAASVASCMTTAAYTFAHHHIRRFAPCPSPRRKEVLFSLSQPQGV